MFAVDSIPAIMAITLDPFLIYTSNALAMLGMRSLYFALAGLLPRFVYLHHGLSAILVFVGGKMLFADFVKVPIAGSLIVIAGIILIAILASLWRPQEPPPVRSNSENPFDNPEPLVTVD